MAEEVENKQGIMTNLPLDFSTGGLTLDDRGYKQQTFLGASIRSFNLKAGFGDESSTLSIELIEDEYNQSDSEGEGKGADVYHNGKHDKFVPPFIGSPVFFTFGKDYATVADAYRNIFDYTYSGTVQEFRGGVTLTGATPYDSVSDINRSDLADNEFYDLDAKQTFTVVDDDNIGREHIVFGGILQSWVEQSSTGGNRVYSAKISDPREILNSVQIILNNYTGGINKTDNIFNVYGFLEHNASTTTVDFVGGAEAEDPVSRTVGNDGRITYEGTDTYLSDNVEYSGFPITGTGFSRRSDRGMPYYRISQAVNWLIGNTEDLPQEYKNMSFGDKINFRGLKYIVDLSGLPAMPDFYSLDYDSMSLLDLCLEICEVTNTDLFVTLLPIIDEPACNSAYNHNLALATDNTDDLIAGMIRVESIDRKEQPSLGAVKDYVNGLVSSGIYVKNSDTGYELSNITTDKFVVGAQESNMHFFSGKSDRDNALVNKRNKEGGDQLNVDQWELQTATEQQIIPYYGTLGNNCVSLPRGWGSYQQILLDTSGLEANGVGNYYVATEMELRCAMAGFEEWSNFLLLYHDLYFASVNDPNSIEGPAVKANREELDLDGLPEDYKVTDSSYAVSAPRSVFPHYGNPNKTIEDGTHKQCNPPMGWPLYWHRGTNIGLSKCAPLLYQNVFNTEIVPTLDRLEEFASGGGLNDQFWVARLENTWSTITNGLRSVEAKDWFVEVMDGLKNILNDVDQGLRDGIFLQECAKYKIKDGISLSLFIKKSQENALKVHSFLQEIAEECCGKKYLVKIPQKVNVNWSSRIRLLGSKAPFGLRPQPKATANTDLPYKHDPDFILSYTTVADNYRNEDINKLFLANGPADQQNDIKNFMGELNANYNPFSDKYEFNYYPESEGGFFSEDLYKEVVDVEEAIKIRNAKVKKREGFAGLEQQLIPIDIVKFQTSNNRISSYVKFDDSQNLYFGGISKNDFTQEIIDGDNFIPDIVYDLENIDSKSTDPYYYTAQRDDKNQRSRSIGFMKCQVDTDLYYLPKVNYSGVCEIYNGIQQIPVFTKPQQGNDEEYENTTVTAEPVEISIIPTASGTCTAKSGFWEFETYNAFPGQNKKDIVIDTRTGNRDLDHVYALITLPSRMEPVVDSRYRDGVFQRNSDAPSRKNLLSQDVVKNFAPFMECGDLGYAKKPRYQNAGDGKTGQEITMEVLNFNNQQLAFSESLGAIPSFAMPDMAVLSLLSTERCYGPWNSQWIDTRNEDEQLEGKPIEERFIELGGAVDFIKEENLAPWNYSGYKGLSEAGKLQAQFANNLLLSSERGSFSYAAPPLNVYLAEELSHRGPLVTNINVSIGTKGITTSVALDLYTVSFGKLHKYRQQKLEQAAREKLKTRDEKNIRIRKNVAKGQKNEDYATISKKFDELLKSLSSSMTKKISNAARKASNADIISSVSNRTTKGFDVSGEVDGIIDVVRKVAITMMQPSSAVSELLSQAPDFIKAAKLFSESAGGNVGGLFSPMSEEPDHPLFTPNPDPQTEIKQEFYPDITIDNTTESDLTKYEE